MMENRLLLLVGLLSFAVSAQVKGVVVDQNQHPVPFVNIWAENESLIATSEADGGFTLNEKYREKTLIFSAIGFQTIRLKGNQAEKVVLSTEAIQLEEVAIKNTSSGNEMELGNYEKGGFRYHMGYFVDGIFFKLSLEQRTNYPYLKSLVFRSLSENQNAKIRMYVLEANPDGSPSNKLLSDEIFIGVKKGNRKNLIDFSKVKIEIPENGFFVVFEKLKIEQNKHFTEHTYKDKNGKKTKVRGMQYQPEIPLVPVDEPIGWHKQMNDSWQQSGKTTMQNPDGFENILMRKYHNKYLVPSVRVILSN